MDEKKEIATRDVLGISRMPKDIYQSFKFTISRYKWSVYEKRIVYRLVELAQCELRGIKFRDGLHDIEPLILTNNREITMPVSDILANEDDKNYAKAKAAFKSLAKKGCEYENEKEWAFINIIAHPRISKGSGLVKFEVYDEFWRLLLKYNSEKSGYRKYELLTAMSFDSIYSMRLYEFVSGQTEPFVLSLEFLKNTLQLTKRMADPPILEEKVLDVAKADLDEKAPYSFTYKRNEEKSRGRNGKKVTGYTLFPYFIHKNRNNVLELKDITAMLPAQGLLEIVDKEVYDILTKELGWTKKSANSNKTLLLKAQHTLPHFKDDLRTWGGEARTARNPIGYVVTCIKNKVEEYEAENRLKALGVDLEEKK